MKPRKPEFLELIQSNLKKKPEFTVPFSLDQIVQAKYLNLFELNIVQT